MLRGHGTSKTYYQPLPERERNDRRTSFMLRFLNNDITELVRSDLNCVNFGENLI